MFSTPEQMYNFVLAGHAVITLESEVSGTHFTYRINQLVDQQNNRRERWFVGLLTGPDNYADYNYLGMIGGARKPFELTKASKAGEDAPSVKGFAYFWNNVLADRMPPKMVVRHENKCGRCGHPLTTPESIDTGFGPECADKLGITWERDNHYITEQDTTKHHSTSRCAASQNSNVETIDANADTVKLDDSAPKTLADAVKHHPPITSKPPAIVF